MNYSRMSEDVYAVPDLTKKARHGGPGERQVEMEERGETEDRGEVNLYGNVDDFRVHQPDPEKTQHAAPEQQHGGKQ